MDVSKHLDIRSEKFEGGNKALANKEKNKDFQCCLVISSDSTLKLIKNFCNVLFHVISAQLHEHSYSKIGSVIKCHSHIHFFNR